MGKAIIAFWVFALCMKASASLPAWVNEYNYQNQWPLSRNWNVPAAWAQSSPSLNTQQFYQNQGTNALANSIANEFQILEQLAKPVEPEIPSYDQNIFDEKRNSALSNVQQGARATVISNTNESPVEYERPQFNFENYARIQPQQVYQDFIKTYPVDSPNVQFQHIAPAPEWFDEYVKRIVANAYTQNTVPLYQARPQVVPAAPVAPIAPVAPHATYIYPTVSARVTASFYAQNALNKLAAAAAADIAAKQAVIKAYRYLSTLTATQKAIADTKAKYGVTPIVSGITRAVPDTPAPTTPSTPTTTPAASNPAVAKALKELDAIIST